MSTTNTKRNADAGDAGSDTKRNRTEVVTFKLSKSMCVQIIFYDEKGNPNIGMVHIQGIVASSKEAAESGVRALQKMVGMAFRGHRDGSNDTDTDTDHGVLKGMMQTIIKRSGLSKQGMIPCNGRVLSRDYGEEEGEEDEDEGCAAVKLQLDEPMIPDGMKENEAVELGDKLDMPLKLLTRRDECLPLFTTGQISDGVVAIYIVD